MYKNINININHSLLDSMERKICYLTCMDFNNSEIFLLLDNALSTIEHRKKAIRVKLRLPDRENLKNYLLQSA